METKADAPVLSANALAVITREETDIAIATAKKFPRSLTKFRQDAMTMATVDAEIAGSCFYKLRRKNAQGEDASIEGPTVRLAEIVASAWGNLKFGARIIGQEDGFVVAQGIAHDLETNVSSTIEVRRRITTKNGQKYGADMIGVTSNAACAIAARNAIFKTVPFTYAKQVYLAAKKAAIGDAKTLSERRQTMIREFSKMSVTLEQILEYTEKKGVDDLGLAEIEDLIGAFNAIKDGDSTIEEVFAKKAPEGPKRASEAAAVPPAAPPAPEAAAPAVPVPESQAAPEAPPPPAPDPQTAPAAMGNLSYDPKLPIMEFEGEILRTNQKWSEKDQANKYGICTTGNRWINTASEAMLKAAQGFTGTGTRLKFKVQQKDGSLYLVEEMKPVQA